MKKNLRRDAKQIVAAIKVGKYRKFADDDRVWSDIEQVWYDWLAELIRRYKKPT